MSTYSLSNGKIAIQVHSFGAELASIVKVGEEKEYLWNADPKYWKRSSPVLFPFVGSCKDKQYRYDGKTYEMGQHGFARDMEFELVEETDAEIRFALEYTEETLQKYPFKFRLEIAYELVDTSVLVKWKVKNLDAQEMHFAIGAHPAFYCPFAEEGKQTEYSILFKNGSGECVSEISSTALGDGGLVIKQQNKYTAENGVLPVTENLFDGDALVIEHHQVQEIGLVNPKGKTYLNVKFDAPLVGVWSPPKKNAPFICIEPWYGRCDATGFEGTIAEKDWENHLEAGEIFQAMYTITV